MYTVKYVAIMFLEFPAGVLKGYNEKVRCLRSIILAVLGWPEANKIAEIWTFQT